jgi:hypothetical protein
MENTTQKLSPHPQPPTDHGARLFPIVCTWGGQLGLGGISSCHSAEWMEKIGEAGPIFKEHGAQGRTNADLSQPGRAQSRGNASLAGADRVTASVEPHVASEPGRLAMAAVWALNAASAPARPRRLSFSFGFRRWREEKRLDTFFISRVYLYVCQLKTPRPGFENSV